MALSVRLVLLQVNTRLFVLVVTVKPAGAVTSCDTTVLAKMIHPVDGLVAVRVYVPGTVVVAVAPEAVKLFGPVQLKVAPPVVELPVSVTLVFPQLRGPELVAVTPAG